MTETPKELMKKSIAKILISFVLGAKMWAQDGRAQGTTYLSDLEQPSAGSIAVGSDQWLGERFVTGSNTSGYLLNSIQLGLQLASGAPTGFSAMIYSQTGLFAPFPGSSLSSLSGTPTPTTAGIYIYTAPQDLLLYPSTGYFIVVTGGTATNTGAYEWSLAATESYNPVGGWFQNSGIYRSIDGSSWTGRAGIFAQFAINATPVPEPGALALFVLGALSILGPRRKAR